MSILDSFFILFKSDASQLDAGLKESDKKTEGLLDKLQHLDKKAQETGGSFLGLVERLAGVAGVALSMGALVHGVKEVAAQYTQLEKLAAQFRSTTEAVNEYRDASKLLGITEEQSTAGLHAMEAAIQDTAMGMGRSQRVFAQLGINVRDAQGHIKATTAVMGELAGKFKGMDKGKQIRIMERLGLDPSMLKLFNADLVDLQKRMQAVDEATGFNLDVATKRSAEFTKASKAMGLEVNTLKMFMGKLTESFAIKVLPYFTKGIELATKVVHGFTSYLMEHAPFVKGVFFAIGAAIAAYLIPSAISGAAAIWAMVAPFALMGLAVAGAIALFALLYDDISNFIDGNDSLIGSILQKWPQIGTVVNAIVDVFKFAGEVIADLAQIALAVGDKVAGAFNSLLSTVLSPFLDALGLAGDGFNSLGDVAGAVLKFILGLISSVLDKFGGIAGIAKSIAGVIRGGLGDAKAALGIAPPAATSGAVASGQGQIAAATSSPIASVSSSAISNTTKGGDRTVKIDKVEVNTQATDADGIARGVGASLGSHLRQAAGQFDDGVAA